MVGNVKNCIPSYSISLHWFQWFSNDMFQSVFKFPHRFSNYVFQFFSNFPIGFNGFQMMHFKFPDRFQWFSNDVFQSVFK